MRFRPLGGALIVGLALLAGCHVRGGIVHRVENGDSLSLIAHVYEVPLKELLEANPRLSSNDLKVGESVLIPGASARRTTVAPIWDMEEVQTAANGEEEEPERHEKPAAAVSPPPGTPPRPVTVAPQAKSATVKIARKKSVRFGWPATGHVISKFGMRSQKMHNGIDLRVSAGGEILAAAEGTVVYVGQDVPGYGKLLILRHAANFFSVYAYVGETLISKGRAVARGTRIARANANPNEAFFHFEIRSGKRAIDPLQILPL
ncbi:MAG: M23 family metallopeptidase [Pseudomonadota bacterium]